MKHTVQGHLYTDIVLEIFKLSGQLVAEGDKMTAEYGLSSARWKILGALTYAETALTVPQIARTMGQTRQTVQRLVTIMHEDGLLDLLNNPDHKRAKLVTLSDKGKAYYAMLEKKQIIWANQHSNDLSQEELEITLATLNKISYFFE